MQEKIVSEVAAELSLTTGRVRQLCRKYGLGKNITSQLKILTDEDVAILRRHVEIVKTGRRPKNLHN